MLSGVVLKASGDGPSAVAVIQLINKSSRPRVEDGEESAIAESPGFSEADGQIVREKLRKLAEEACEASTLRALIPRRLLHRASISSLKINIDDMAEDVPDWAE